MKVYPFAVLCTKLSHIDMTRLQGAFAGRMGGEFRLEDIVEIDCMRSDTSIVLCASPRNMPIGRCRLILLGQSGEKRIELFGLGQVVGDRVFLEHKDNFLPLSPACSFIGKSWLEMKSW